MTTSPRTVLAVLLGAAAVAAVAGTASAQEKVWKHGILNPKSDAGILAMVGQPQFGKELVMEAFLPLARPPNTLRK